MPFQYFINGEVFDKILRDRAYTGSHKKWYGITLNRHVEGKIKHLQKPVVLIPGIVLRKEFTDKGIQVSFADGYSFGDSRTARSKKNIPDRIFRYGLKVKVHRIAHHPFHGSQVFHAFTNRFGRIY